jgi:hypothetical protein
MRCSALLRTLRDSNKLDDNDVWRRAPSAEWPGCAHQPIAAQ